MQSASNIKHIKKIKNNQNCELSKINRQIYELPMKLPFLTIVNIIYGKIQILNIAVKLI